MARSLRFVLAISGYLFLTLASLFGQSRIDCSALKSRLLKRAVRYCVYLPSGYDSGSLQSPPQRYPVLYFLHGLGDNEQTLFNSGGFTLLDDLHKQPKMADFLIVAPEGRRSFYINAANGSEPYSDFFLREFIPYIESKYRIQTVRTARAISGISMGGYGALRFAFAHAEMFSAVSAQSPALITETPQQLDAAGNSGSPLLGVLGPVFGKPIDVPHWKANDPFSLARRNAAALHNLAIYFNCGAEDKYGFEKGAAALDHELSQQHVKHEYHAYPGDHSITYFLSHFAEVMEFHSKAFGLSPQR